MSATKKELTPAMLVEFKEKLGPEVEANLTKGGEEGLNDRTLTRWLVARKLDMARAVKDLTEHAAWRAEYVPNGHLPESEVQIHLDQAKSFLAGCDKEGHPTVIARVKNHHKVAKDASDFHHYMVYMMDVAALAGEMEEKRTGRKWDGKAVAILDMQNITLANCDGSALLTIFDLLQNHYVERLHRMYLYCAPLICMGVWAVAKPFIDPVTRKKVHFVTAKGAAEIFARDYDEGVLTVELGGSAPDRPCYLERRKLLQEQQAYAQKEEQSVRAAGEHLAAG